MTPADLEIARAWGASPGFRWRRGMATTDGHIVIDVDQIGPWLTVVNPADYESLLCDVRETLPDVNDPATKSCFRELVRERRGPLSITEHPLSQAWSVAPFECAASWGNTEAEALFAAWRGEP